jgi:copper(I)-binding protein
MARRVLATSLLVAALIAACGGGAAGGSGGRVGDIEISNAWVRPSPEGGTTTAFYMTIDNAGTTEDRLVAASSASCAETELHESTMQDDVMQMRPLLAGIVLPAGTSVVLGPVGLHVMCLGVADALQSGETSPLTLEFERAGSIEVAAEVRQEP